MLQLSTSVFNYQSINNAILLSIYVDGCGETDDVLVHFYCITEKQPKINLSLNLSGCDMIIAITTVCV